MPKRDAGGFQADDANTPLDEDESEGLIPPHLTTRAELNQWEANNIASAQEWAATRRLNILEAGTLRELHLRMFNETWEWAGHFRQSDKNISPYGWPEVPRLVRDLLENTQVQYETSARTPEELDAIAVRFHHGLVHVHPFPNGNGRHARLATDLLLLRWSRPAFTWGGSADFTTHADARDEYIKALKRADAGDFDPIARFARS